MQEDQLNIIASVEFKCLAVNLLPYGIQNAYTYISCNRAAPFYIPGV